MSRPDFYLASNEGYGLDLVRACFRVKRLHGPRRDDYLLVRIDPPLIGQQYGLGAQNVDAVVLATRDSRASLFPVRSWPVFVHVARLLVPVPERSDKLEEKQLEEIAWGELYENERSALAAIRPTEG